MKVIVDRTSFIDLGNGYVSAVAWSDLGSTYWLIRLDDAETAPSGCACPKCAPHDQTPEGIWNLITCGQPAPARRGGGHG